MSQAFSPTRVARGVAIETEYKALSPSSARYRPVQIAVVGPGSAAKTFSFTKRDVFSALEVAQVYGYDNPIYHAVNQLLPALRRGVGDIPVTVFPLEVTTGTASAGTVTPSGTASTIQTYTVNINNIVSLDIVMAVDDTVADFTAAAETAIQGVLGMPMIASDGTTVLNLTAGWEGASGDDLYVEVISPDDADLTFVIVQPTSGAGTTDVDDALSQFGSTWYSHVINCQGTDTAVLDKYAAFNELRWAPDTHKPFKCYTGEATTSVVTLGAITDARKSDRTNSLKPNPASNDLPFIIAARQVFAMAVVANVNAPRDYGSQVADGLKPVDASEWTSAERQYAVVRGLSTVQIKNGAVNVSDSIMMYHPDGEEPPAYRYDCDIEKICAMIYNVDLIFNNAEVDGSPLPQDDQAVTNPSARKPKSYLSKLWRLFDVMGQDVIITDVDYAKDNTTVDINGSNPKRLDATVVYKLAGNGNVFSITQQFSFFFGGTS
jgi:phage tail sheath gpL-like